MIVFLGRVLDVTLDLDQPLRGQQGQDPELEFVCQGLRVGWMTLGFA